jgi:hypothetical protein
MIFYFVNVHGQVEIINLEKSMKTKAFSELLLISRNKYSASVHINIVFRVVNQPYLSRLAFESSKIIFPSSSMGDGVRISTPQLMGN